MTDHNTTGRIDKPETVIGPITLGQSGGDAIVSTTFGAGTTVTPDQLGLTGTVELTAIVALPDCLSLNVTSSGAGIDHHDFRRRYERRRDRIAGKPGV